MQSIGREMEVLVDRTPKCHCELAGKEIRYSRACAKKILLSGFSEEEKGYRELKVCGAKEHVDRQSVNNKRDKTFFKALL